MKAEKLEIESIENDVCFESKRKHNPKFDINKKFEPLEYNEDVLVIVENNFRYGIDHIEKEDEKPTLREFTGKFNSYDFSYIEDTNLFEFIPQNKNSDYFHWYIDETDCTIFTKNPIGAKFTLNIYLDRYSNQYWGDRKQFPYAHVNLYQPGQRSSQNVYFKNDDKQVNISGIVGKSKLENEYNFLCSFRVASTIGFFRKLHYKDEKPLNIEQKFQLKNEVRFD